MAEFTKMTDFTSVDMPHGDDDDVAVLPTDENDEMMPFDDLNDPPGKFSWNPKDWYHEFQKDYKEFSWTMSEKRRVVCATLL